MLYPVNDKYNYENYDVWKILCLRLQQKNLDNIFIIPPIAEGNTRFNDFVQQLEEERIENNDIPNRTILIPYNLYYHDSGSGVDWAGIIIKIENNILIEHIYTIDEIVYKNDSGEIEEIKVPDRIKEIYKTSIDHNVLKTKIIPTDGPLIIEYLIEAALG